MLPISPDTIDASAVLGSLLGAIEVPPITALQCDALFDAVLAHDEIYLEAELPDVLHLDYGPEQFRRGFALSLGVWDGRVHRPALTRLATKLALGGSFDGADTKQFKEIRARFKQLRFAYLIFDEEHRHAPSLHRVTKMMGHLQDALKHDRTMAAAARAIILRFLLMPLPFRRIQQGIDRFRPSTRHSFHLYVAAQLLTIRSFLAKPTVTGKDFHEIRKVASRMMAFYDVMNTLYPSGYHRLAARFVSTINGLMGNMHDGLIERRLNGKQDYHADTFPIPIEIAGRLRQLERGLAHAYLLAGRHFDP